MAEKNPGMSASYDEHSTVQMAANQRHISLVLEALKQVDRPDEVLTVADFGSATGLNSIKTFSPAFQAFRLTSQTPIWVYHCDLPTNPWSVLFTNVLSSPHSYLSLPHVYTAAVGRSFYSRLFPANSVSVGYTTFSLHWLSTHSQAQDQLEKFVQSDPQFHAELRARSNQDLDTFLTHRAAELRPGGRLVLHMITDVIAHKPRYDTLLEMEREGLISHEPLRRFPVHVYHSTPELLTQAVARQPHLQLLSIESVRLYDPLYQQFLADGDAAEFGRQVAKHSKAVSENIFLDLFREEASPKDLVDTLFQKTEKWYATHPEPLLTQEVDAVIGQLRT